VVWLFSPQVLYQNIDTIRTISCNIFKSSVLTMRPLVDPMVDGFTCPYRHQKTGFLQCKMEFKLQSKISIFVFAFFPVYAIVYLFHLRKRPAPYPKVEEVCVTGLPARTARPFVPPFFVRPTEHFPPALKHHTGTDSLASVVDFGSPR